MWSIICHGGAGSISSDVETAHREGCEGALRAGVEILERGGAALDAVCETVRRLEDNPVFNAGIGATVDENGMVSCDAAVCNGRDLGYGAVGAVSGVRHPIDLARAVMEDGRHALLVGPGAIQFARQRGIELVDPKRMETDPSRARWWFTSAESPPEGDTVGAVARDRSGHLAAATSTGGLLRKYAGRVGDSPIAGAGTYARDDLGAVSATGHGETFMRTVFAFQALQSLSRAPEAPEEVLRLELDQATARIGGRGGAILVLPDGRIAFARNTDRMGVAWAAQGKPLQTAF